MRKKCLTCGKEWIEGKPDDGLISHGICSERCGRLLELWSYSNKNISRRDFARERMNDENLPSTPPLC